MNPRPRTAFDLFVIEKKESGQCVCSINDRFQKELFIIGLTRMNGAHNAENIKQRVEYMINKYSFDKSKVDCKLNYHISNI